MEVGHILRLMFLVFLLCAGTLVWRRVVSGTDTAWGGARTQAQVVLQCMR